jgi:hypothetical protein
MLPLLVFDMVAGLLLIDWARAVGGGEHNALEIFCISRLYRIAFHTNDEKARFLGKRAGMFTALSTISVGPKRGKDQKIILRTTIEACR